MALMMVKEFLFDAAHYLPTHTGKCRNIHGHTYKLQVGFQFSKTKPYDDNRLNENGMIMDFYDLKILVQRYILDLVDHKLLNNIQVQDFPCLNPTAENMVEWIIEQVNFGIRETNIQHVRCCFVRLHETPTSYVEWRNPV